MAEAQFRCAGCGKPIEVGEDTKQVTDGKMRETGFEQKKEGAHMHRSCFNRRADAPQTTMDELRRQARAAR